MPARFKPSPAMVVACAALLVALGGTGIAAVSVALPRNSVGTAQLRNSAVNSLKVADRSLKSIDFAMGQLPAGPAGPAGPTGASGFADTLPSGKTLRGNFSGRAYAPAGGQDMQIPVTFQFALSDAPTTHYVASGAVAPGACPGTAAQPSAAPGNLCVYESAPALNSTGKVFDPIGGADDTANKWGFGVVATSAAAGDFRVRGSWAVTAP